MDTTAFIVAPLTGAIYCGECYAVDGVDSSGMAPAFAENRTPLFAIVCSAGHYIRGEVARSSNAASKESVCGNGS